VVVVVGELPLVVVELPELPVDVVELAAQLDEFELGKVVDPERAKLAQVILVLFAK